MASIVARSRENVARQFFAIRDICNLASTADWIILADSTSSNLRPAFLDAFSKVKVPIHTIVFELFYQPIVRGCVFLVDKGVFVRFLKIPRWRSLTIVCGVFDAYTRGQNTIYEKSVPLHAQVFLLGFLTPPK